MFWNADKTTVEKSVFLERISDVLEKDEWILDGNYISTMEMRMAACDTVIFLDYPLDVCLDGIQKRRGKPRLDMPWIEGAPDEEFIELVKRFEEDQRKGILPLIEKHRERRVIVFRDREEANAFLSGEAL